MIGTDFAYIPATDQKITKDNIKVINLQSDTLIDLKNGFFLEIPSGTIIERFSEKSV